jgi:hypothetical protein
MAGSFLAGFDRDDQRIDDDASLPLREHLDGVEVDLGDVSPIGIREIAQRVEAARQGRNVGRRSAADAVQELFRGGPTAARRAARSRSAASKRRR